MTFLRNFSKLSKLFNRTYCSVRTPMITPIWWTGKYPIEESKFIIDCSKYNLHNSEYSTELIEQVAKTFNLFGLVKLTNTKLIDLNKMQFYANQILGGHMKYNGGANSRGAIGKNVYDTGAPREAHLHYHHEMAYVGKSVKSIAFCCSKATTNKGFMYVSENVGVTNDILKTDVGRKLKERGICYIRCLTDREHCKPLPKGWNGLDEFGIYNHWQRSFGVETPQEVEELAKELGLVVEWGENRYCKTKYYADAFEYHPQTGVNHLYSSVADDSIWFDTWPGVKDLPTLSFFNSTNMYERPLKITYGDDTELTREELIDFISAYDNHGLPIKWGVGDILAVCNYRWAHGRPSYTLEDNEERELGVLLGSEYTRIGSKW